MHWDVNSGIKLSLRQHFGIMKSVCGSFERSFPHEFGVCDREYEAIIVRITKIFINLF